MLGFEYRYSLGGFNSQLSVSPHLPTGLSDSSRQNDDRQIGVEIRIVDYPLSSPAVDVDLRLDSDAFVGAQFLEIQDRGESPVRRIMPLVLIEPFRFRNPSLSVKHLA